MTDRVALLDLKDRWAAVGVDVQFMPGSPGGFSPDRLVRGGLFATWVMTRERWQIGTMPPAALRVFADWIQEGEASE